MGVHFLGVFYEVGRPNNFPNEGRNVGPARFLEFWPFGGGSPGVPPTRAQKMNLDEGN